MSLALYLYVSLFRQALIDDAFITLQYVKTLLTSGTWGFFPGVVGNSATSPLNVILLTAISLLTGPTPAAALWLYLVGLLCTGWLLVRLSASVTGSQVYGWLALGALTFNPLLISTIGLESILFVTCFVLALYGYQLKKWGVMAIALGLLTLTRPEGALFLLLFLAFVPGNRQRRRVIVAYGLCILPWYVFSWIHLGSLVPDTFFIKTEQRTWLQWDFFNGLPGLYFEVYPVAVVLSFIFLPLMAVLSRKKAREVAVLTLIGLAGLVHFLAYSLLEVPPFHWYYVPEVSAVILLGSLGLGVSLQGSRIPWQRRAWTAVTVAGFLVPALGMAYLLAGEGFVLREMPVHSNWATQEQYREIGLWLKQNHPHDTIRLQAGEIGTLAYYCDCYLLDRFSDRSWLAESMVVNSPQAGGAPILWRINFAFYVPPDLPPDEYSLRAYFAEPDLHVPILKEWRTSTKWISQGFLILSPE